jgi:uncharacterized protein YbjT (DUF2867 family)
MRVLLTGASGFIGRHLLAALRSAGHIVVTAGRQRAAGDVEFVPADFSRDFDASGWKPKLVGIEVVINTVGIFRESGAHTFDAVHVRAPQALFEACVAARVQRVIQLSALGADANARTQYHLSKRRADEYLSCLPIAWTIIRPSLVYGGDGRSAQLFTTLASLPIVPLPGNGAQSIQPVHIDDMIAGVCALIDSDAGRCTVIPFVGPTPATLREYLATLRASMGLGRAPFVNVPTSLVQAAALAIERFPGSLLSTEALEMLFRGNTGDPRLLRDLLGREARQTDHFITPPEARTVRISAQLNWLLPVLRLSIAFVWIFTGIVSLGLYPADSSYELLARVGVPTVIAPVLLYGAAAMDIVLGVATLVLRRRRYLWLAQIAVIVFYTVIISVRLPEFWLHPYGPLTKNLPMLAAIWALYTLERR